MLVIASVLGTALSLLAVGCGDDDVTLAIRDADADADVTADAPPPDPSEPSDAGRGSDARGAYDPADVPVVCDASPCATQIVAGGEHFCARMSDGTVRCWGHDGFGVLGTFPEPDWGGGGPKDDPPKGGTKDDPKDPPKGDPKGPPPSDGDGGSTVHVIPDLTGVTQLSAAGATTCALLDDGSIKCWGDNRHAQLGLQQSPPLADEDPHPTPSLVALDSAATRVDVGHGVVCARLASGKLWCWGKDSQAQLVRPGGDMDLDPMNPVRGPGIAAIEPLSLVRVAASNHTMLGLTAEGTVWTWGALAGDLGTVSGRIGSISPNPTPRRLDSLAGVTSVVASVWIDPPFEIPPGPVPPKPPARAHACALANGEVYCWGRSYQGALCTGFPDPELEPAHAPFASAVKAWPQQLAVGDEITCARMTDGSVHCCGSDRRGRLGTGTVGILSSSFTEASAFTSHAVAVATSDRAVCALVVDGTVECWGSNEKGELGRTRDYANHPSPVKIAF